ncbi:hypothetical protein M3Y96_00178700 [Aphelenchoides besseyi]|nr:hypothetical protein M3Y96_00178700 [Aphelenchoides besseyi]
MRKVDFGARFFGFGQSLRSLVSVLFLDFFDPPMLRLLFLFKVVGLLSRMAMAGCQVDAGETTIDLGKCDNGAVKLKFNGSKLKFNIQYGQKDSGKTIKLVVGGCDFKFDSNAIFYFPVPVKVSSSGIVVGKGSDANTYPCASFKSAKNNIVDFKVETVEEISGLQIRLDGATVFAGVHEESQWGVSGWRLWTCIGCGVALLLIVVVGGGIWYYRRYKKKRRDAEAAQLDKNGRLEGN